MSLSYTHTILDYYFQKKDIHLSDVYLHWYFDCLDINTVLSEQLELFLIYKLAIIKPKGHSPELKNKQKAALSTTCKPLSFELPT